MPPSRKTNRGPYVLQVQLPRDKEPWPETFPFTLPLIQALTSLPLHPRVTLLLGENGAGKSTLLEAIAVAAGLNPEGGSRHLRFQTRASHSSLGERIRLVRGATRPPDAYLLRSETLYTLATALEEPGLQALDQYGGKSLHERSRGEAVMALVTNRLSLGLFLFDEPEAGLSPTRQLAFLSAMHQLVRRGSQLILATHAPILLAYPDAYIYELTGQGIERREFEETDHYRITKDFFAHRQAMLKELLSD